MQTINAKYANKKQPGAQEVSLYIEGLPSGGSATVADGSVTTEKLADGAVTTDKIGTYAVGSNQIAEGAISTGKLETGCVSTNYLANGAVTAEKIASGVIPEAYTLPAATTGALGGVKQVAFVADPAGDTPTKAELVAIRDALVASGLMAAS